MAMNVGASSSKVSPTMNVTPLVDVVLVLLIIFMVVTPLLTKKFWLNVPKKNEKTEQQPPPDNQKPVVLTYHKDGTIKINSEPVRREELVDRIGRVLAARADNVVFFDAESDADYGEAVSVMDLARGGGAATIAVLTEAVAQ
jgi:biopolymer transport protein TolR